MGVEACCFDITNNRRDYVAERAESIGSKCNRLSGAGDDIART